MFWTNRQNGRNSPPKSIDRCLRHFLYFGQVNPSAPSAVRAARTHPDVLMEGRRPPVAGAAREFARYDPKPRRNRLRLWFRRHLREDVYASHHRDPSLLPALPRPRRNLRRRTGDAQERTTRHAGQVLRLRGDRVQNRQDKLALGNERPRTRPRRPKPAADGEVGGKRSARRFPLLGSSGARWRKEFDAMARRREGRKDAIVGLLFPIFCPVIPAFSPVIPVFSSVIPAKAGIHRFADAVGARA